MNIKIELIAGEIRTKKGLPESEEVFTSKPSIEVLERVFTGETVDEIIVDALLPRVIYTRDVLHDPRMFRIALNAAVDTNIYSDEESSRIMQINAQQVIQDIVTTFTKKLKNSDMDIRLFGSGIVQRAGEIAAAVCALDQQNSDHVDRDISVKKLLINMGNVSHDDVYFNVSAFKGQSRKAFAAAYYELCRRLGVVASPEFKRYL